MWLLKRAATTQRQALERAVRPEGVTAAQVGVLSRLLEQPGLSASELGRRLLITPQAAQVVLIALEERGLVRRRPDPSHGRIIQASLTAKGRRVAATCRKAATELQEKLLADLDPEERRKLAEALSRVVDRASELGWPEG